MAVTKTPSGCKITRNGNKFTFKWSIKDKNHGDGQRLYWSKDVGKANSKGIVTSTATVDRTKKSVSKTAKDTDVTVSLGGYYPSSNKFLLGITFEIQGKRKNDGKKSFSWSGFGYGQMNFSIPDKPKLSQELDANNWNVCKFSWNVKTADTDKKPFKDVEWQAILVKEFDGTVQGYMGEWDSSMLGWQTGTSTNASGSQSITEDTTTLSQGSYTRIFRARARGCAGPSEWVPITHVYARPNQAEITPPVYDEDPSKIENDITVTETASGYEIKVSWTADASKAYPVDSTAIKYAIGVPRAGMLPPVSPSWQDAKISKDTSGTDTAVFSVDQKLEDDQCIWVRVDVTHDRETVEGVPTLAKTGYLADPSNMSVSTNDSTYRAQITATNNSTVPDSVLVVYYRPASQGSSGGKPIGIIPHGQTSVTVQCPNWSEETAISFGVKALVGTYTTHAGTSTSDPSSVTISQKMMESEASIWEGGDVPKSPSNVAVNATSITGTVRVSWDWTWSEANGAEISWSDHIDAWESTDEPEAYTINNLQPSAWNIANLETGVTWYIRVRLFKGVGDTVTYGPWSEITSSSTIDLATAPSKPTLLLSAPVIAHDGSVTASWVYSTNDGTDQSYAEICEATIDSTGITYGDVIAHTETAQHVTIYAEEAEWETGETYNLCVRVRSASGKLSDEWSDPQSVIVAEPLEAVIASTSLETVSLDVNPYGLSLTEMPLTVTITGAGTGGTTTLAIERAEDFFIDRPNEDVFNGYEGETVVLLSQDGEGQFTVTTDNIIGALDDTAAYRLVATVEDGFGQKDETTLEFEVHWDHQAIEPKGRVRVDLDELVAMITPIKPTGATATDVCDIYRLSADKPELIYAGAEFGTTYVDPYPAIGPFVGHRLVLRTANGDYKTTAGGFAWLDLNEEDWDILDVDYTIIDFDGYSIRLRYNMDVESSWSKDFTETKYLGGSVQGDWNPAVSRTGSVTSTMVTLTDTEDISAMRRLAAYPGICHIRTVEGSSYACNIDVTEKTPGGYDGKRVDYTLKITRVDPEGYDGMTYDDWLNR